MATAELSRRVEKVVGYPPLSELGDAQRREFYEALERLENVNVEGLWLARYLDARLLQPWPELVAESLELLP